MKKYDENLWWKCIQHSLLDLTDVVNIVNIAMLYQGFSRVSTGSLSSAHDHRDKKKTFVNECTTGVRSTRETCWLRGFPTSAPCQANKPERHKTAFRTFIIQIWSCTTRALKPVPAAAERKPLCFLKHQERRHPAETNTHGEDFLRLPTRSHVGVVDLFEDHPCFIVLPHLTVGRAGESEEI